MRLSLCRLAIVLLGMASAPGAGSAQTVLQLQHADKVRLAEARHLADQLCDRIWAGWGHTAFQILLVGDSAEFLVGDRRDPGNFTAIAPAIGSSVGGSIP